MPEVREFLTVEEIVGLLEGAGFETSVSEADDDPESVVAIIASSGDVSWCAVLGESRPFHDSMHLIHIVGISVDAWMFADEWNEFHVFSKAIVGDEEMLEVCRRLDGVDHQFAIRLQHFVTFQGGVTLEHLTHVVEQWHDDIAEIEEMLAVSEDEDDAEMDEVEVPDLPDEAALVDQVAAFLAVAPDRSAREIARFYGAMKHEVNQVLYRHPDRFERRDGSPPRWSLRVDGLPGG